MSKYSDILPKKHLGQNFLVSAQMQAKITTTMAKFISAYPEYSLLEVGPGRGDLTKYFVHFNRPLYAVDIDEDLRPVLAQQFQDFPHFNLHFFDVLHKMSDLPSLLPGFNPNQAILLSNLPFSVGSRILVDLAMHYPHMPFCIILQKEVNDKFKSDSHFTLFSAWIQLFYKIQQHFSIPPHAFYPQPNVTSSLISAHPHGDLPDYLQTLHQRIEAFTLLKTLFSQPKKTVWNNLKLSPLNPQQMQELYAQQNWPPSLRLTQQNYTQILPKILEKIQEG